MVKPLQLNRLPKAGRLRTVRFKGTTPGSFLRLFVPQTEKKNGNGDAANNVLDPSHRWADRHPTTYQRKLPSYQSRFLGVYAYPQALLGHYENPRPVGPPFDPPPKTLYGKDGRVMNGARKLNMSLMHVVSLKKISRSAVIRNRVKSQIKAAVRLIVTRDASVEKVDGKEVLVSTESDDGEKWVLQDWTYVFAPTLDIYRMPLVTLIPLIQQALSNVNAKARKLEYVWKLEALASSSSAESESESERSRRIFEKTQTPKQTRPQSQGQGQNVSGGSPAESISRVRALFKPYASSSAELIDDELLLEDEEDEDEDLTHLADTSMHRRTSGMDSSLLVKTHLPPRHTPSTSQSDSDEPSGYESRIGNGTRIKSASRVGTMRREVRRGPSIAQAIYSRKPIFKPEVKTGKEKPGDREQR